MNYWVTPIGEIFSGKCNGGSWHTKFCEAYLDEHEELDQRFNDWYNKNIGYIHEFFEEELKWVRYCDWGEIGWVVYPNKKLTKKQKEKIFELTGYVFF